MVARNIDKKIEDGIFRLEDKRYLVELRPNGRGSKQFRRIRDTLAEARREKKLIIAKYGAGDFDNFSTDNRRLKELCDKWFDIHGYTLTSGNKRLASLHNLCAALNNPIAKKVNAEVFLEYRKERLNNGISENHLNHELVYLKSVFNELERNNLWGGLKPFDKIRKLKVKKKSLRFLEFEELDRLLKEVENSQNSDLEAVVKISLATGCRFGEANGLRRENIRRNFIEFVDTKNGRNRTLKVEDELITFVLKGRENRSQLFTSCESAFGDALDRAKIKLPKGQRARVLRHTVASHYMMGGGDILELKEILGHEVIQMTMVYAHLAPKHLERITELNPLAQLSKWQRKSV